MMTPINTGLLREVSKNRTFRGVRAKQANLLLYLHAFRPFSLSSLDLIITFQTCFQCKFFYEMCNYHLYRKMQRML